MGVGREEKRIGEERPGGEREIEVERERERQAFGANCTFAEGEVTLYKCSHTTVVGHRIRGLAYNGSPEGGGHPKRDRPWNSQRVRERGNL